MTIPTVCGSRAHASNAAPPLKSISRKVSRRGSAFAASAAIRLRSSSLLPEPVVPPTRPCGPSRSRSSVKTPCSLTPTGPAGAAGPARRQRRRTASGLTPSSSSSGSSRTLSGSPAPTWRSSGSSKRARSRAQPRAVAGSSPAAISVWPPSLPSVRCTTASPSGLTISITVLHAAGSRSRELETTMPATGSRSSGRMASGLRGPPPSSSRAGELRPSISRSESSTTSVVPLPAPAPSRRRSVSLRSRRADSHGSSSLRVWGSHFAHSQSGSRPSSTNTPIVRSAGP